VESGEHQLPAVVDAGRPDTMPSSSWVFRNGLDGGRGGRPPPPVTASFRLNHLGAALSATMSTIDKQRIEAVRMLETLGYTFAGGKWSAANDAAPVWPGQAEADLLHRKLILRADALEGCTKNSPEEQELEAIIDAIEAYEAVRWPTGKVPNGKG
jgi:hypothetical protein